MSARRGERPGAGVRVAMIGAGGIARRHLEALTQEGIEVVAHVARTARSAEAAAARWGGRPYTSAPEMLRAEAPDAAWITVPPAEHGEIELSLVAAGVPFFVEKPLAADRETPERIAREVERAGLVTGVGYQWRAMDTVAEVREVLRRNPPQLVLGAWHGLLPAPAWWRSQAQSGGQMVEQVTHLLDLARSLVGEARVLHAASRHAPRADAPGIDVASASVATLLFESGAIGSFTATSLLPTTTDVHLQLVCEGTLIIVTRAGVTLERGAERLERRLGNDPFRAEARAFLEAVRRGDPAGVFSSYADALRTHRLAMDVLEAAERDRAGSGADPDGGDWSGDAAPAERREPQ